MFYTVYKVTNLVNGKIYVGLHVTKNLDDEYLGSGKQIQSAVKKYGRENFKREYIKICETPEEMYALETTIVNEEFVKRTDTYNMKTGGIGGWDHWNGSEAHIKASKEGGKKAAKLLNEFMAEQKANNTQWWKEWYAKVCETNKELTIRALSPKSKAKRKATFEKIKHQAGKANSQFGRIWISNMLTKEVKRSTINTPIPEGWVRGKKGHLIKECWVNNGVKEHFINLSKKQEYLDKGFSSGRLKSSVPQKRNSLKVEV